VRPSGDYNAATTRTLPLALSLAVLAPTARAQEPPFTVTTSAAHARVFAPPARADRFAFSVTGDPIDAVANFYRQRWPSDDERSWVIAPGPAVEAFDSAAVFDRARLARLYGGRLARIARGPIARAGTDHVVMLLSPYPEADLRRLNPGTLIMEVSVTGQAPGARSSGSPPKPAPSLRLQRRTPLEPQVPGARPPDP
jgi:hypothetical protein